MRIIKKVKTMLMCMLISIFSIIGSVTTVSADESEISIRGKKYEFEEKVNYVITEDLKSTTITGESKSESKLNIKGDLTPMVEINGVPSYGVSSGNVTFSYIPGAVFNETKEDEWHLVSDSSKEVNGKKLSKKIAKGAIIVQTSQDGNEWIYDVTLSDAFKDPEKLKDLYKTKNIQLVSGCFYRITVAYKLQKKTGENKTLFIKTDVNEEKKIAEVFEFYLHDAKSSSLVSDSTVSMSLGTKTRTSKNEGYYGTKAIDIKDPHYGWDLGNFFVSGYTDDTTAKDGTPVFLKNVGDQVTLWFNLEQDIDRLNGNDNLEINVDKDGYDRDFEIKKTNFGRGALLIRKTNYQNKAEKPELYTNYLEANATTDANTVVGLFEEGDYEVALDYEIKNTPRQVIGIDVIPEYSDYTIRFKFSIRNSNCMVFPFDIETGEELIDNAITPNGFKLDLARSRYLTVNVQKFLVSKGNNGYVLDERFNRAAKDGDIYDEEGVYVFSVSNEYTGKKMSKTIYVGESLIIKALANSGMTLEQINNALNNGGKIDKNGKVITK